MKKLVLALLALTLLCAHASAQGDAPIIRRPGESLQAFGARIIPRGMSLAHPVVVGDFGTSAGNIVVLFRAEEFRDYTGWALVSDGSAYRKFVLPDGTFPVATTIRAVFFDNADSDTERELFVLCRHISGIGRAPGNTTPFYNTYIYDLDRRWLYIARRGERVS